MERKITLITNYYPPEMGAASNRIALMANFFKEYNYDVQVLCPLPNYPTGQVFQSYQDKGGLTEEVNGIRVTRLNINPTNSTNLFRRFKAMISFAYSLWKHTRKHKSPELVLIQYSPQIVGVISCFLFRSKKHKIILNVSDLWPLAGKELGHLKPGPVYTALKYLERYAYRKAHFILGQSQEILDHIVALFPNKPSFLYRNFPDFDLPIIQEKKEGPVRFVYAGLMGVAQGVLSLCKHIKLPDNTELYIYGSGTESKALEVYITESEKPIFYKGSLSRKELHHKLMLYDITLVPLSQRIYGSVPSKIFEYTKLGLPLIYSGGGEGEGLVKTHKLGWVIKPQDYDALNMLIKKLADSTKLSKKNTIRNKSLKVFNAKIQFENFISFITQ